MLRLAASTAVSLGREATIIAWTGESAKSGELWRNGSSRLVVGYFDRDFVRIGALWTAFSYSGDDVEVMSTADHLAVLVSRRFQLTLVDSQEGTAGHFAAINVITICGNIVVGPIKRYGVRRNGGRS
jgi:hypothetical protein